MTSVLDHLRRMLATRSLHWNFFSNVMGRLWTGILSIVSVPIFVRLLGAEAFGIVSFVATFQTMLAILDLGLAGTVRREVSKLCGPEAQKESTDTIRTFELFYWVVALAIGIGFIVLSGWLSRSWVTMQSLPQADIRLAIQLGGIAFAVRWPVALYTGILQGLERQVLQNSIQVVAATARVGATILALLYISRTVQCFLATQAFVNIGEAFLNQQAVKRLTCRVYRGCFSRAVVQRVWRYAVGFNLVGAFGMLTSGADKLLISKMLPLVQLTYYSVASTATGALQFIYLAAQTSLFPRMTACWHRQDTIEFQRLYLLGMRFSVYLCTAPAVILIFFPREIVFFWTRSVELTAQVAPVLPILALSSLANCAVATPLNSLLAAGQTRAPLLVNMFSLPIMVLGCFVGIKGFGLVGASTCWLAVNLIGLVVYGRCCVKQFWHDQAPPFLWGVPSGILLVSAVIGFIAKFIQPKQDTHSIVLLWPIGTALVIYLCGVFALSRPERKMLSRPILSYWRS